MALTLSWSSEVMKTDPEPESLVQLITYWPGVAGLVIVAPIRSTVPEQLVLVAVSVAGPDGLKAKAERAADSYERGTKTRWSFDGEWRKQQIPSGDEYLKDFAAADTEYAEILTALIKKAK